MWSKLISLKSFNQLNYNCKCNQLTARAQISCFVMLSTRNMCKIVLLNSCLKKKLLPGIRILYSNIRGLPWTRFYGTVVEEKILLGRICGSIILSTVKLDVFSFKDNEMLCHIICLETIQINKLWYIQKIEYYSILKRNEIFSHEMIWKKLIWILLKKTIWKYHALNDSTYMTLWKGQNYMKSKSILSCQGLK